jgi:predicted AAA+ superfamily ATPase
LESEGWVHPIRPQRLFDPFCQLWILIHYNASYEELIMRLDAIEPLLVELNPWWSDAAARPSKARQISRDMLPVLLDYVGERGDRRAALLAGPRQVGKTVLLLQVADRLLKEGWPPANITYFDFSDARLSEGITIGDVLKYSPAGAAPERPRVFLLDEIANSANWDRWLKQAVDLGRGDRLIVTDSAVSLLREGARESGQGRWDPLRIEGLSFVEFLRLVGRPGESSIEALRRVPNAVDRYLSIGGFPEHVLSDPGLVRERLRDDIADRAIRRDLRRLGVDVERVRDLFVYLVQDSGAIFNARMRARDMGADERSARQWLQSLEDAHLLVRLPRHSANAAARLRSQPKVYASDHGLIPAFTPSGAPDLDPGIRGRVLEAAVFRHLRDVAAELRGHLSFFRNADDLESDFVLDFDDKCVVIEVTASADPPARKFGRLKRVGEALKASHTAMVQGGLVRTDTNEVSLSLADYLLNPLLILGPKR